ncbi:putative FAD-dependent monooxygenase fsr3 [Seiridium cardinale]|uniref:FAD-dependent monooxygenase fsr3 n=1 Tax=Seiridium cardinale TaxID=138064 RepID=A0ABR2Y275_9PEZI
MVPLQSSAAGANGAKLDILVVGHGLGGLVFAIDAKLRGHQVRIFEKNPGLDDFGDVLILQASGLRSIKRHWPGFWSRFQDVCLGPAISAFNHKGELIVKSTVAGDDGLGTAVHRLEFHALLHEYAIECGIDISFSKKVTEYFEDADNGGVILSDGTRVLADLVVAADGVGSHSWGLVLGKKDNAESTGYGVFRANYPSLPALQNPVISKAFAKLDSVTIFVGSDAHIVISKSRNRITFLLTHREESQLGDFIPVSEALRVVEGWDPLVTEIMKEVPDHRVYDWRLKWRDTQSKWVSDLGRVVQIGDAAHSFLPTSGYGCSTAMEDGHSLAECLSHVERKNVGVALRVHNHLRFERTACAQKMGFKTRELWHKMDWASSSDNTANLFGGLTAPWLRDHDPEEYARERFQECANHLQTGTPFRNTNGVPGYTYTPWTIASLNQSAIDGRMLQDEGEWFQK